MLVRPPATTERVRRRPAVPANRRIASERFVDQRFFVLPALVIGFPLQRALQGGRPPAPFFRRRGVRTAEEIAQERAALKALRGEFQGADETAAASLAAARA